MKPRDTLHGAGIRLLVALAALLWAPAALTSTGAYATAGTGTYAQSLWWLDMTGYSPTTVISPQSLSFTLPSGAGTLTTSVYQALITGANFAATAEPAATAAGALGHGAYNVTTGSPVLYASATLATATVNLTSMAVKDASGNVRTFTFYAADGENTAAGETLSFTTNQSWSLVDTENYYAAYNGVSPTLGGNSTTRTVTGSGSAAYNAAYILGTTGPSTITAAVYGVQGVAFAIAMPTVTLNVVAPSRSDTTDQFTAAIGYTTPAVNLKTVTTTGTVTTAATGATSVIGTNSITVSASMGAGSSSTLSNYAGSISCTNSGPGSTTLPSGAGTSFTLTPKLGDAITCTLTLTSLAQTQAGTVYIDTNHDATLSGGEAGTTLSGLYVKLAASTGGVCQSSATLFAAVSATTGAYQIPSVFPGTYCLTLTNTSSLSNVTAYLPAGYVGTEAATGVRQLTAVAASSTAQNFGLYAGSSLSLTVFGDTGAGSGGGANDGVQNGSESGSSGVVVTASVGGSTVTTGTTTGNGTAVLWLPSGTSGTVTVTPTLVNGYLATGGSAGTTSGSYARPAVTFTYAAGNVYGGVTFGSIAPNTLAPSGTDTAQAGGVVFYPHTFVAGGAGQLTLASSAVATPTVGGWNEGLFRDSSCSGQFVSGDPAITGAIAVTAGQRVCFLVKEFVPAGAPFNAQNKLTVTGTMVYSGTAAPATASAGVTDTTTVSKSAGQLTKQVQNVSTAGSYATSNTALPGATLQYQITLYNQGTATLSTVVINDSTPAYTTFASAACPGTLPSTLTTCAVTAPSAGSTGTVRWTFGGSLSPGTQATVTYQVTVAQ